jgi:hypothetical protein
VPIPRRISAIALAASLLAAPCLAGKDEEDSAKPYGFRRVGEDARTLALRPFRLERAGKIKALAVAGTALALFALRDEIREEVRDHRSSGRGNFLQDARTMGKGAFAPSLALVAYGASFATRNDREKETAFLLLESAGFSAVLAYTGSYLLAVERPEDGDSIRFADTDGRGVSLDAALAASVVPVLHRRYLVVREDDGTGRRFWKRSATAMLYSGAALTAYQRIHQDKHWAPDAFLGMMTGLLVGENLCRAHGADGPRRVRLSPALTESGPALMMGIRLEPRSRRIPR